MRGFTVTVLREVPAYAGFYAGFETGKQLFRAYLFPPSSSYAAANPSAPAALPVWALMASGSLGGISNWLACYPLDVIKSRVQQSTAPLPRNYILHYARTIAQQEGGSAFFRGLSPTCESAIWSLDRWCWDSMKC